MNEGPFFHARAMRSCDPEDMPSMVETPYLPSLENILGAQASDGNNESEVLETSRIVGL